MPEGIPDFSIKQHDTWPPLQATLTDQDGPINLTNATAVRLIMKGSTVTVTGGCTVVDPVNGVVSYAWAVGDLAVADNYQVEFEITWNTGTIETVPNDGYMNVSVVADLG